MHTIILLQLCYKIKKESADTFFAHQASLIAVTWHWPARYVAKLAMTGSGWVLEFCQMWLKYRHEYKKKKNIL